MHIMFESLVYTFVAIVFFIIPIIIIKVMFRNGNLVKKTYMDDPYDKAGEYRQRVISVISGSKKHLTLVRGEIPFSVYDSEVADALTKAKKERQVTISIVCGPMVVMKDDLSHPVLSLVEDDIINLYYADISQSPHYIEADGNTIYLEDHHEPGATIRKVTLLENSRFIAPKHLNEVKSEIKKGNYVGVLTPKEKFILLRESENKKVMDYAKRKGINLDLQNGNQLSEIRDEALAA